VEQYNEEMKNEIAITRRATYKVEETLQNLGKFTIIHVVIDEKPCHIISRMIYVLGSLQKRGRKVRISTSTP